MTKILFLAIGIAFLNLSAMAGDKPDLKIPSGLPKLAVSFVDTDIWSGKKWPRIQQCAARGGVSPLQSPSLKVTGAPESTQQLVVFFNNARAMHNHGLFSYQGKSEGGAYTVPSVANGATSKLPAGVALFQAGSSWGAAFNAACPSGGSWKYTVTVYALDAQEQVIATHEIDIGWAE